MNGDEGYQHEHPHHDKQRKGAIGATRSLGRGIPRHLSEPVWVGRAVQRLVLEFLAHEPGIDQLIAQVFGQRSGVSLILHDARRDQYKQLGSLS